MDSSNIKIIVITIITALISVYLGVAAATAQFEAIGWVASAILIVIFFALGKNIWILIPMTLPLVGAINAIPGAPFPWWGAMSACGLMYAILFLMRRVESLQFRFTWIDAAVLLQFFVILQAFMRNPTGLLILGGENAGGKPYFTFMFAFICYFLLSCTKTDLIKVHICILLTIVMTVADGTISVLSQLVPSIGVSLLPLYSNVVFASTINGGQFETDSSRLEGGKDLGISIGLALFSLFPPVSCINPIKIMRFAFLILAVSVIGFSGFRSALGLLAIYFTVGSIIRKQYNQLIVVGSISAVVLFMIVGSGIATQLPYGAQRILSAIPFANVDDRIRENAENSSEFRFRMWEIALTSDKYIQNKVLGDGFRISSIEQQYMINSAFGDKRAAATTIDGVEDFLLRGSFHGFHVETIRFTGIVGLIAALITMGILFKKSLFLLNYYKNDKYFGIVAYICIPFLVSPFYYMLVFGSYRTQFPILLASAGLLKVLDNIRVNQLSQTKQYNIGTI